MKCPECGHNVGASPRCEICGATGLFERRFKMEEEAQAALEAEAAEAAERANRLKTDREAVESNNSSRKGFLCAAAILGPAVFG